MPPLKLTSRKITFNILFMYFPIESLRSLYTAEHALGIRQGVVGSALRIPTTVSAALTSIQRDVIRRNISFSSSSPVEANDSSRSFSGAPISNAKRR